MLRYVVKAADLSEQKFGKFRQSFIEMRKHRKR